jgi:hypothetical protein
VTGAEQVPGFVTHFLDLAEARVEVADLRTLLVENADLKESALRRFFRIRLNASVLIGHYNPAVQRVDRVAYEYPLFGDFRCDLAHIDVGEHERLRWRREHVIVNSKRIICVTYDQLLDDLEFRLDWLGAAALAGG